MTSSLRSDDNDAGPITIPRGPVWGSASLEAPAWVFVRLWSVDEFHRAGEVAFLPDSEDCWFGREDDDLEGFAHLAQQRPGEPRPEISREHLLASTAISRRQLELRATVGGSGLAGYAAVRSSRSRRTVRRRMRMWKSLRSACSIRLRKTPPGSRAGVRARSAAENRPSS